MTELVLRPLCSHQTVLVQTLGEFRISCPGQSSSATPMASHRPLQLLKTLITCRHFDQAGFCIETLLWPHVNPKAAKRSLITATHRLRDYLGESRCLQTINGKLALDSRYIWVDAWAFEKTLNAMDERLERIDSALRLYRGRLFQAETQQEETQSPLMLQSQERLHKLYVDTVIKIGKTRERRLEWAKAIGLYRQAIEIDDLAENCYQALLRCYLHLERIQELEQLYQQCEARLRTGLGISPSEMTKQIYKQATSPKISIVS